MSNEHDPAAVLVVHGGDVPYRAWMRVNGVRPSGRRRNTKVRRRRCVACGVVYTRDTVRWSVDHIIPQVRLDHAPELVRSSLNHQWLCRSGGEPDRTLQTIPAFADWPPGRPWDGCNEAKGNGPAVDHRGNAARYRQLVRMARELGVDEPVGWDPQPWRGVPLPVPQVV